MWQSHMIAEFFHMVYTRNKLDASTFKYYDTTLVIAIQLE